MLRIGMDYRGVATSNDWRSRWVWLVHALMEQAEDLQIEVYSEYKLPHWLPNHPGKVEWIQPEKRLRFMHHPFLGKLRAPLWKKLHVAHFLSGDGWYTPSRPTVISLMDIQYHEVHSDLQRLSQILDAAERVVVDTREDQWRVMDLFSLPERKLEIIPPGTGGSFSPMKWGENDRQLFRWKINAPKGFFLHVGNIYSEQDFDNLLELFAHYWMECADGRKLVIVGDLHHKNWGRDPQEVIRARGLKGHVHLTGWISQDLLQRYYSSATILVDFIHSSYYPYPLAEGISCGCTVISSRVKGIERFEDSGVVFLRNNQISHWVESILHLMKYPDERKAHIRKGLGAAIRFTWTEPVERMLQVYHQLTH